jgi:hypothetical protein
LSTSTAASGEVDPAFTETTGVNILRAGLFASFIAVDSDAAVPADHGGTANSVMAIGANLSTGACTAATSSLPDTFTEVNSVQLYKNVTSVVTTSTSQTYTPCYVDIAVLADTTAGFQVSGAFVLLYRVDITQAANSAPTVSAVVLNNGSAITLTPNTTTSITTVASTTDAQGPGDIRFATSTIYRSSILGSSNCTANDVNCYQVASSSCSFTDSTSTVQCTALIWYFAHATDASSSFPSDTWLARITVTDAAGAAGSSTASGVELNTLLAIEVTTSSINYGTVTPGANTGATNQTTTVQNAGNASSSLELSGTALTLGVNELATSSQRYATSSFTFGGSEQLLSGTPTAVSGFLLTSPTSTNAVSSPMYWGIEVAIGKPTGTYSGTNTFTAVFSP